MMKYTKSPSEATGVLGLPYNQVYRHKHQPEFQKITRCYAIEKIADYFSELDRRKEAAAVILINSEDELLEKQIKLETARHKCKLLELQIKQKKENLIDVNVVLESRSKELNLLRNSLKDIIQKLPIQIANKSESECRIALGDAINGILSNLSEFIQVDWEDVSEAQEID